MRKRVRSIYDLSNDPLTTEPIPLLTEFFRQRGYVRVPSGQMRESLGERYHKGYEVRLSVDQDSELSILRALIEKAGLKPARPFKKHRQTIQPVYGRQAVEWFLQAANQLHWQNFYLTRSTTDVSWYQEHLQTSLRIIASIQPPKSAHIIDVGGGDSSLVDDLLGLGYDHLTVVDISNTPIDRAKARLGANAARVTWIVGDITQFTQQVNPFSIWHDRAVFHFLIQGLRRQRYIDAARRAIEPGGHMLLAIFAPDGPKSCSGLQTLHSTPETIASEFGPWFKLLDYQPEMHKTPNGVLQHFYYYHLIRNHDH
jgi:ubiquinone/menaquinone biosynthesis C-methylase UbiE